MSGQDDIAIDLMKHLKRELPKSFWMKVNLNTLQPAHLSVVGCWRGWYIAIEINGQPIQTNIAHLMQERADGIVLKLSYHGFRPLKLHAQEVADQIRSLVAEKEKRLRDEIDSLG